MPESMEQLKSSIRGDVIEATHASYETARKFTTE